MATWNTQYKQNPTNDNNPGYGAAAIRDLKTNLESIVGNEHNFSLTSPSVQGQHKPGSAIIDLAEDTSTIKVNNLQVGRLKGSTDGDSKTTLQVKGLTADLNIMGYNQMSLTGNETVSGIKTFTSAPLVTQTIDDNSDVTAISNVGYVKLKSSTTNIEPSIVRQSVSVDTNLVALDGSTIFTFLKENAETTNLEEQLSAVNAELVKLRAAVQALSSKNQFNQDLSTSGSPTLNGLTVSTDIVATGNITGAKVYGAVWG